MVRGIGPPAVEWGSKLVRCFQDSESIVRRAAVSLVQARLFPPVPAAPHIPAALCVPELLGGTRAANRFGQDRQEAELDRQPPCKRWAQLLATCLDDIDWEVGLRTMELLRLLGGIRGPQLVDAEGRWLLDHREEFYSAPRAATDPAGGAAAAALQARPTLRGAIKEATTAAGAMLFWEGDCGTLLEMALSSSDKPIRISAAALLLRMNEVGSSDAVPALDDDLAPLAMRRHELLSRLPHLVERARAMLEATSSVQRAQDLGVHVDLDHNDEGQLECPD